MNQAVERIFKEEMDAKKTEGILETLAGLVKKGLLSLSDAAKEAGMSPDEFQTKTAGMK